MNPMVEDHLSNTDHWDRAAVVIQIGSDEQSRDPENAWIYSVVLTIQIPNALVIFDLALHLSTQRVSGVNLPHLPESGRRAAHGNPLVGAE
jgi:hypothetical protein